MKMMKKEKSPGASKMKLLLVLPIIALLVFAFAKKEYVMVNAEDTSNLLALNQDEIQEVWYSQDHIYQMIADHLML